MEKERLLNIKTSLFSLCSSFRTKCLSFGKKKYFSRWFRLSPHFLAVFFLLSLFFSFSKPLPFSMLGTQFNLGFYLSLIGILLFTIEILFKVCDREIFVVIKMTVCVFAILLLSSLLMAMLQYPFFKGFREYNYWFDFFKGVIKWSYNAVCFCYIVYSLRFLKPKHLLLWTYISTYIFLFLTIIQFLIYLNTDSSLAVIYDKINFLHLLNDSSFIARIKANNGSFRAFGFSSEPAGVQFYSCVIWIPCYLWCLHKKKMPRPQFIFHIFSFLVSIGLIIMTASSSVYVFVFAIVLVILLKLLINEHIAKKKKIIFFVSFGISISLLFIIPFTRNLVVQYFAKVLDFSNQSTLHRYSSFWNAICIFAKFPLIGIGDGLQGLYYFDNMLGTVFQHNLETQTYMFEGIGLSGGGAMIPTIISAFGLLGLIFFICYIIFCVKVCRKNTQSFFSFLFLITLLGAVLSFTISSGIYFSFPALFYFALPLTFYKCKDNYSCGASFYEIII